MKMYPLALLLLIVPIAIGFAYVSEHSSDTLPPLPLQQPQTKTAKMENGNIGFVSVDGGKTWEETPEVPAEMKRSESGRTMVQSSGVMIATGEQGIKRSTDDGNTWQWVISEGGVGIDVATINGGFAAITFNTQSKTRRIRASYDGGITWKPIDEGLQSPYFQTPINKLFTSISQSDSAWHPNNPPLPEEAYITSIIEVDGNFYCGHPKGVFRSGDKGKTWELLLPSIEGKVYQLHVLDNVMYAIPRNAGC